MAVLHSLCLCVLPACSSSTLVLIRKVNTLLRGQVLGFVAIKTRIGFVGPSYPFNLASSSNVAAPLAQTFMSLSILVAPHARLSTFLLHPVIQMSFKAPEWHCFVSHLPWHSPPSSLFYSHISPVPLSAQMYVESHMLTPLVPTRESFFLRCCKLLTPSCWAVVDVSVDRLRSEPPPVMLKCRRRPSGIIIQVEHKGRRAGTVCFHSSSLYSDTHPTLRCHPCLHLSSPLTWMVPCYYLPVRCCSIFLLFLPHSQPIPSPPPPPSPCVDGGQGPQQSGGNRARGSGDIQRAQHVQVGWADGLA